MERSCGRNWTALLLVFVGAGGVVFAQGGGVGPDTTVTSQAEPVGALSGPGGPAPTVYGPGERMVFEISYGPIIAGEGILETIGTVDHLGRTCYHVQSTANSNRFFSSIYKVRDKIVTYIDVFDLGSAYFYKRLREGDYKKTLEITFDRGAGLARYGDGQTIPVPAGVQDELSAFYYVRNLDLESGTDLRLPAHTSGRNYDMKVVVHGRETVEVPAGKFDCFVVEPVVEGEGLFKHEGRITIYISADEHRVPVLMKTKVPVGSIDVALKEYRPGVPLNPRRNTGR
jgi:hypothetical protein